MTQESIEQQIEVEAEAARRIAMVKSDRKFMIGLYQAMKESAEPVPWKALKRKHARRP